MPLSAYVNDRWTCAPLLSDGDWHAVRGQDIRLSPCGHRGFARVSVLGTRHFVHERHCPQHHTESMEHLRLKALVAQAVAAAEWTVGVEHAGDGWIADVLASSADMQVAFEVQWSRQSLADYERRQARYADDGVRGVWLVRAPPVLYKPNPGLPLFLVRDWHGAPEVVMSGRAHLVGDAVRLLLAGRCEWSGEQPGGHIEVRNEELICQLCGTTSEARRAVSVWVRCHCGYRAVDPVPPALAATIDMSSPCGCGRRDSARRVGVRTSWIRFGSGVAVPHWCVAG